ncbi:MAG: DMT family transporter [Chloroflexota bacterium]|jgi:DME family drug/metabolite transporter|nr:DMT family transporter [Chloroflexota bacterium]
MGELLALIAAFCWAVGFVVLRRVAGSFHVLQLNAMRLWGPALMMPVGVFLLGIQDQYRQLEWMNYAAMTGSVLLGIGLGDSLLFVVMRSIGVVRSYSIGATAPMFGLVYAVVLLGEEVTPMAVLGTAVIIGGGILVTIRSATAGRDAMLSGRAYWRGVAVAVAIAMMWGADFVMLKIGVGDLNPIVSNSFRMPLAAISISLLAWRVRGRVVPIEMTSRHRVVAVISGTIGLGAGSIFFLSAIQTLGAARAGALAAVSPVFTILLAAVILRERPGWMAAVGTVMAVTGIVLLSTS